MVWIPAFPSTSLKTSAGITGEMILSKSDLFKNKVS